MEVYLLMLEFDVTGCDKEEIVGSHPRSEPRNKSVRHCVCVRGWCGLYRQHPTLQY